MGKICVTLKNGESVQVGECIIRSRRNKIIKLLIEAPREITVKVIKRPKEVMDFKPTPPFRPEGQ